MSEAGCCCWMKQVRRPRTWRKFARFCSRATSGGKAQRLKPETFELLEFDVQPGCRLHCQPGRCIPLVMFRCQIFKSKRRLDDDSRRWRNLRVYAWAGQSACLPSTGPANRDCVKGWQGGTTNCGSLLALAAGGRRSEWSICGGSRGEDPPRTPMKRSYSRHSRRKAKIRDLRAQSAGVVRPRYSQMTGQHRSVGTQDHRKPRQTGLRHRG